MRIKCLSSVGAVALALGLGTSTEIQAQDSSAPASAAIPQPTVQTGIAVYASDFFSHFSPVTALDMVQRVPGFSLSDGDTERRGLGDSFGNVLINGSRPANKSLSLETVLQRIPTDDVERIELIQEAMPDYDMRGHARLVNVVLREGSGNSGSWDFSTRLQSSGRLGPGFNTSYTANLGDTELSFGLEGRLSGRITRRRKATLDATDSLTEFQIDNDQVDFRKIEPTFSLNWEIDDRSNLRLDTKLEYWAWKHRNVSFIDAPSGSGLVPLRFEQNSASNDGNAYLATLTYDRELNDRFSMQSMALISRTDRNHGPEAYETYDVVTGFEDAVIVESFNRTEETAFRQTLSYDPNPRHSLEFGAEIALNARETELAIAIDDGNAVTPIDIPVANTHVEETRSEIFANHVWTISDALSLESGLRYESSEIVQTGDANQSRTFSYPKPSLTLNWRQNEQNRLRLTGRRDVDQLQFDKFASSVDVSDNNSTLGNPDYVPQRTWTLEAEWERRLGDDGSFSLKVGHDWIEDLDGFVAVVTPGGVFDAPGNIGDGTNFRVTGNLTTPMDDFGLSNGVLDVFLEWYNTNITDPLTGLDRSFDGVREWELKLDYRQTFPVRQMAWGFNYHWASNGEVFRARESRIMDGPDGDLDLYLETTRWTGVTTRLGVNEAFNNGEDRQRVFFDGSRADGIIRATEYRNENRGPVWYLELRGTF